MNKRHSNEYYADLREALTTVIDRVYVNEAPEGKTFPYVVFSTDAIYDGYKVTVDLWGRSGPANEAELEDIADSVEEALDGYIIANDYHTSMLVSNDDRQWMRDEDPTIKRIMLSFNATYQS